MGHSSFLLSVACRNLQTARARRTGRLLQSQCALLSSQQQVLPAVTAVAPHRRARCCSSCRIRQSSSRQRLRAFLHLAPAPAAAAAGCRSACLGCRLRLWMASLGCQRGQSCMRPSCRWSCRLRMAALPGASHVRAVLGLGSWCSVCHTDCTVCCWHSCPPECPSAVTLHECQDCSEQRRLSLSPRLTRAACAVPVLHSAGA